MTIARQQRSREQGHLRSPRLRARSGLRLSAALLMAGVLVLGLVPAAVADKSDRAFPSREQVEAAERRAADTARDVGAIQASLLLANRRLEKAAVEAEMASEAYNGAMWRLQLAQKELVSARSEAASARRTVAEQRATIGARGAGRNPGQKAAMATETQK